MKLAPNEAAPQASVYLLILDLYEGYVINKFKYGDQMSYIAKREIYLYGKNNGRKFFEIYI